ncbi:hypothetical protein [Dendrosporobacter sp. 1207_IL3150]|uniref:hypothetical protein n=1 Tax=Dendrosporobacter sp. 1207_IL3150 TaxID=3084054 RepID=UPI002FDA9584
MKQRYRSIASFLLMLYVLPVTAVSEAFSGKDNWVSLGAKNSQFSVSFGARSGFFGWEIGGLNGGDYASNDIKSYPTSENGYISLGDKNIDGPYGLDILHFADLSNKFTVYGGVGLYFQDKAEVAQSTTSGLLYTQSSRTSTNAAYSGGLQFRAKKTLAFGLGYHTVRGTNAQVMVKF